VTRFDASALKRAAMVLAPVPVSDSDLAGPTPLAWRVTFRHKKWSRALGNGHNPPRVMVTSRSRACALSFPSPLSPPSPTHTLFSPLFR
jgi:hypothetical protein